MLTRSSHFRTFVALLLTAVVPFCCCNFHSWVIAVASCSPVSSVDEGRQFAAEERGHQGCHHSGSKGSDSGRDHHQDPAAPEDGPDPHDCTCGKNEAKMMAGEKPTIELPTTVLIAILNWATVACAAPESSLTFVSGEVWACARPRTSLLSMHCALIV